MMMSKRRYVELHTLEWDLVNSVCRECFVNGWECMYYRGECRQEKE